MAKIGIDPGHGGTDPGACSGDYRECDFTLAVSLELKKILEEKGHEVIMTRTDDIDVYGPYSTANQELGARVSVMNDNEVDVSISIHCNSAENISALGTETFYMSSSGKGSLLAQYIHTELVGLGLVDRGTKAANFALIKNTDMPAVLVELAFISNDSDRDILITRQWALADCIYKGVSNWLNN